MGSHEGVFSIKPPLFNGSNLLFWKIRTRAYLQSLGANVWGIMEGGYQYPASVPTNAAERKRYEINAKVVNALLGSFSYTEFVKVMQLNSTKEIWDKIIHSYEGDGR